MNLSSERIDAYKEISLEEAAYSNNILEKEYYSFHFETCLICKFHNVQRSKPRDPKTMNEKELIMFNKLQEHYKNNPIEKRKMIPHRGSWMWCYVCERCKPEPEREKKQNLRNIVHEFLNN